MASPITLEERAEQLAEAEAEDKPPKTPEALLEADAGLPSSMPSPVTLEERAEQLAEAKVEDKPPKTTTITDLGFVTLTAMEEPEPEAEGPEQKTGLTEQTVTPPASPASSSDAEQAEAELAEPEPAKAELVEAKPAEEKAGLAVSEVSVALTCSALRALEGAASLEFDDDDDDEQVELLADREDEFIPCVHPPSPSISEDSEPVRSIWRCEGSGEAGEDSDEVEEATTASTASSVTGGNSPAESAAELAAVGSEGDQPKEEAPGAEAKDEEFAGSDEPPAESDECTELAAEVEQQRQEAMPKESSEAVGTPKEGSKAVGTPVEGSEADTMPACLVTPPPEAATSNELPIAAKALQPARGSNGDQEEAGSSAPSATTLPEASTEMTAPKAAAAASVAAPEPAAKRGFLLEAALQLLVLVAALLFAMASVPEVSLPSGSGIFVCKLAVGVNCAIIVLAVLVSVCCC
ncbi:hypothetical protein T492DRAFT_881262 [Pavlovales sp. CCMP2436]|nr:hypothetical protein T492DRAFT_881262 [Pavlovales sp. CCMP2436]